MMRPFSGTSSPATQRSSVVLPEPDWPSSATMSPRGTLSDTPFRIWLAPRRFFTASMTSSDMGAHPQAQRQSQSRADDGDAHDRQRRNGVERARAPERDDERADRL